MIKVLIGKKGTGKTKTLISNINDAVNNANGHIVFVSSDTKRHMYDISHNVRMIDTGEFEIDNFAEFYGFLCGIISNDFDISNIYVDSLFKIVENSSECAEEFFAGIEKLSKQFNISFLFTISLDASEAPEAVKKYIMEIN